MPIKEVKIIDVIDYLENIYPLSLGKSWDKNGLQLGFIDINKKINQLLISLDCTFDIVEYAINKKINLILTHHPFLFDNLNNEFNDPLKSKIISFIEKNNILVYSLHSNFDFNQKGMNYQIAKALNLIKIKQQENNSFIIGELKEKINLNLFLDFLKKYFQIDKFFLKTIKNNNHQLIKNILITAGAFDKNILYKVTNEIDLIITGEIKWSTWLMTKNIETNIVAIGHQMENKFSDFLKSKIKEKFPNLKILTKKNNPPYRLF
jgi:GTP cyclohydrolase I